MALSSVATTNQLGFVRHAAWVTLSPKADHSDWDLGIPQESGVGVTDVAGEAGINSAGSGDVVGKRGQGILHDAQPWV